MFSSLLIEQRHHGHQAWIPGISDTFHASCLILQTTGLTLIHSLLRYGSSLVGCSGGLPQALVQLYNDRLSAMDIYTATTSTSSMMTTSDDKILS